jgi:hypothetical protein
MRSLQLIVPLPRSGSRRDLPERCPKVIGERLDRRICLACAVDVHLPDDLVGELSSALSDDLSRLLKGFQEASLPLAAIADSAERRLEPKEFGKRLVIRQQPTFDAWIRCPDDVARKHEESISSSTSRRLACGPTAFESTRTTRRSGVPVRRLTNA